MSRGHFLRRVKQTVADMRRSGRAGRAVGNATVNSGISLPMKKKTPYDPGPPFVGWWRGPAPRPGDRRPAWRRVCGGPTRADAFTSLLGLMASLDLRNGDAIVLERGRTPWE